MPIYFVNAGTMSGSCDFSMFVEAREPIEVLEIYKRDVPSSFNVPVEDLEIKDVFEVPQPNGRNRVLPWSDTEGVWSVVHLAMEPVSNYTIVGRTYGDDEVSVRIYNDTTESEAAEQFRKELAPDDISDTTRRLEGDEFTGVYIDTIIRSEAPMSES